MEDAGDPPLHWQPPTTVVYRRRRQPSPPLFDSSLAIVILPCLALLFLYFLIHNFNQKPVQTNTIQYSYNPQNYPHPIQIPAPTTKPAAFSFRRSWESLNVFLIVAAILFGVLARRPPPIPPENQSVHITRPDYRNQYPFSGCQHLHHQQMQHRQQLQHQQWFQIADNRRIYGASPRRSFGGGGMQPELGGGRLRRTSSAYPDFMRDEALLWEEENRRLRFFDDFGINSVHASDQTSHARHLDEQASDASLDEQAPAATINEDRSGDVDEIEIKEIPVDDFAQSTEEIVMEASDAGYPARPISPAPPLPPPLPPVSRREIQRTSQSVSRRENAEKSIPPPTKPPPTPPLPPPTPPREHLQKPEKKLRRKKSNTTKEIAMVLASLYGHGKRKRKHQKKPNRNDPLDSEEATSEQQYSPPSPLPPPPPPPPPPSVFSFFKKSSKIKKIHSVSGPPPPPPPPRPPRPNIQIPVKPSSELSPARRSTNSISRKPPLPARRSNYYAGHGGDESPLIRSGSQSPHVQIPAPPPLPPFGIPAMKFSVVRGGEFVRILSAQSSRAGSPERESEVDLTTTSNVDESRLSVDSEINGGSSSGPSVTCPSPDVNAKADTFIARHHSGWRLESINSWREKRMGSGP